MGKSKSLIKEDSDILQDANDLMFETCMQYTCEDRCIYIAGKHYIIEATTSYENCKSCNRSSHEQN